MAKNMRTKICWTIGTFLLAFVMLFSTGTLDFFKVSADSNQTIADGTYYVKNKEANRYMQLDDNDGSGYNDDGVFMELWSYGGIEDQRWMFTYLNNGYYKIISKRSGKALSVKSGKENADDTALIQETYTGNYRQQWNAELNSSGSYSFRCRASDPYRATNDWAMSAGDGLIGEVFIGEGLNVEQKRRSVDDDYRDEWILEPIKSQAIVIVPGITGCHLANSSNQEIWVQTGYLSQLACNENGQSLYSIHPFNDDDHGTLDLYEGLYDQLIDRFSSSCDIIFFDYDWRLSCANAAYELEVMLSEYSSCILVAHSMGGLVASSYLARSASNRAKTIKFISICTPYTGAAKALQVIEDGNLGSQPSNASKLKPYAKNIPAVYELLPNQNYFVKNTTYIHNGTSYIYGYDNCNNYMKGKDWALKNNGQVKPMFQQAENFHNSLYINGTHVTELVDTYKIYGYGEDTPSTIVYNGNGEYETNYITTNGDGTVLINSALNNVAEGSAKTYKIQGDHALMLKYWGIVSPEVVLLIKQIINGSAPTYQTSSSEASTAAMTHDLRISVTAKNIASLKITTDEGYSVYADGERLYYDDINGETHRVGTIWYHGENFCQYILYNDEYNITDILFAEGSPLVRVDYYTDNELVETLRVMDFSRGNNIHISERTVKSTVSDDIMLYKRGELQ